MNKTDYKELLKKCFGKEKDDRYHAIAMLILYGLFFLVIIIMIRVSPASTNENNPSPSPTTTNNPTSSITNKDTTNENQKLPNNNFEINYSYIFTVENNGIKEVFTGKRLDDKEIFTYITSNGSTDYARLSNNYLIKENGEYHLVDSPSQNLKYTDIDTIISLTEKGTLTRNENIYQYSVPTSEALSMYDSNQIADTNIYDTITVTLENDIIKTIDIDLSNYASIINGNITTNLTIKMEFNQVGTTENFDVTVSN